MEERFTPKMLVDYRLRLRGMSLDELGLAPVVVITWMPRVAQGFDRNDWSATGTEMVLQPAISPLYR